MSTPIAAPYLYFGHNDAPDPRFVMERSGIRWFTFAFILADSDGRPTWESTRLLLGGPEERLIAAIRAVGGDVMPSFGGWEGDKLGPRCSSPAELAAAYQEVIDAYDLSVVDVDIENVDEFEDAAVQDRTLEALRLIKAANPGLSTILTFGTGVDGPGPWGVRLVDRAAELGADVDVFTIMPFNFGAPDDDRDMTTKTIDACEGLRERLTSAFGWDDATAYSHMGISGMNGVSDQGESTTVEDWRRIRDWADEKGLARLAFWSVNRDHGGGASDGEFTSITAGFGRRM